MTDSGQQQFYELSYYTLALQDSYFIHQHIVDAQMAQTADVNTKPISVIFSLVGLYLFIEKNYSGKQVQNMHMQMAKNKKLFPKIILPSNRGDINISDVLAKQPGIERNEMIRKWCASVWEAYQNNRETIINITQAAIK